MHGYASSGRCIGTPSFVTRTQKLSSGRFFLPHLPMFDIRANNEDRWIHDTNPSPHPCAPRPYAIAAAPTWAHTAAGRRAGPLPPARSCVPRARRILMSGDQLRVYPSGRLIGKEDRGTKNSKVNTKMQGLDRFRLHGVQYPMSCVVWCLYCVGWVYKRGCHMLWSYGSDGLSDMPLEGPPWQPYIGQRPRITSRLGSNPIGLQ
jgi:hypothetical protein